MRAPQRTRLLGNSACAYVTFGISIERRIQNPFTRLRLALSARGCERLTCASESTVVGRAPRRFDVDHHFAKCGRTRLFLDQSLAAVRAASSPQLMPRTRLFGNDSRRHLTEERNAPVCTAARQVNLSRRRRTLPLRAPQRTRLLGNSVSAYVTLRISIEWRLES